MYTLTQAFSKYKENLITLNLADDRRLISLESSTKAEALDYYLTIADRNLDPIRNYEKLCAVMSDSIIHKGKENYIFIKKIGIGGFSTVYEVRDKINGKIYAMKVLSRSSLEGKDKMRQVVVEKKIIEQLDHPFIVKSYSVFSSVIS